MRKVIQLKGLDCAGCAAELERKLTKIDGVQSASIAFVTQRLTVEYTNAETLENVLTAVNNLKKVHVVEEDLKEENTHECACGCSHSARIDEKNCRFKEWMKIIISAVCFIIGLIFQKVGGDNIWLMMIGELFLYGAYCVVAYSIFTSLGNKKLNKDILFDENFLMSIASVCAILIGEMEEAVLVVLLYQIGELLQKMAVGSSRRSLKKLMELKCETATLLVNGEQKIVAPADLKIDDIVVVKAGEKIPADGVLLSEEAILDTKSLTGESEYKHVKKGEEMLSGCINAGGMYEMRIIRLYQDSAVGRILDMVENAAASKAEPEKFITKFAKYYTPIICCFALAITIFAPLLSALLAEGRFYFKDFGRWLHSALTFLVISCPCALVISVPLTYFSGIGACANRGVLAKGSMYLDVLTQAKMIAFDKTGTLTQGDFTVCAIYTEGVSEKELMELVTAAEKGSAHPIAKALMGEKTSYTATNVREFAGRGVRAEIDGDEILVGNAVLFKEHAVSYPQIDSPYTHIYVAKNGVYCGALEIGDKVRAEAKETVAKLKEQGFNRVMMLTGDSEPRAYKVAHETGVTEVHATLLPDEKLQLVKSLKKEGLVVYVGDGINDAPVMTVSDCAISMGQLGSAAAVEASDLVLISDNLSALTQAVQIAKRTREIVIENIVFSIVMKAIFMILGLCGVLPLWLAVFADVGVMLLAVLNSFRVRIGK